MKTLAFLVAVAAKIGFPFLPFASFFVTAFLLWRLLLSCGRENERRITERNRRQSEIARYLQRLK